MVLGAPTCLWVYDPNVNDPSESMSAVVKIILRDKRKGNRDKMGFLFICSELECFPVNKMQINYFPTSPICSWCQLENFLQFYYLWNNVIKIAFIKRTLRQKESDVTSGSILCWINALYSGLIGCWLLQTRILNLYS